MQPCAAAGALPRTPPGALPLDPVGGSAPKPWPAFKKAGENWLENGYGFPAEYAGGPLIGSGPLAWYGKAPAARGGGGRAQRAQSRGGGPWPPPLLWFCGPFGPAKRRRPRRTPSAALRPRASASPSVIRRLPMGSRKDGTDAWGRRLGAARPERATPGPKAPGPLFCLAGRGAAPRAAPRPPNAAAPLRPSEKGAAAAGCGPGGWAGKRYGFTAAWNAARSASASSVGSYR